MKVVVKATSATNDCSTAAFTSFQAKNGIFVATPGITPCSNKTRVKEWSHGDLELPFTPSMGEEYLVTLVARDTGVCTHKVATYPLVPKMIQATHFRCQLFTEEPETNLVLQTPVQEKPLVPGSEVCEGGKCAKLLSTTVKNTGGTCPKMTGPGFKFSKCRASGDVHYKPFGGEKYDFQGSGPYSFLASPSMKAQVFNCPKKGMPHLSLTVGTAFQVKDELGNAYTVTTLSNATKVNGVALSDGLWCLNAGAVTPSGGKNCKATAAVVEVDSDATTVKTPGRKFGEVVIRNKEVDRSPMGYLLAVYAELPAGEAGASTGLCSAAREQAPSTFIDPVESLFSDDETAELMTSCCTEPGSCSPPEWTTQFTAVDACSPEESQKNCGGAVDITAAQEKCSVFSNIDSYNDCVLDYCATCGDADVVAMVAETEMFDLFGEPFELGLIGPGTGARGDPHCENVLGEAFDIHATGALTLVAVPRVGKNRGSLLTVKALIEPVSSEQCSPTVIKQVNITGQWLRGLPEMVMSPTEDGTVHFPRKWRDWVAMPLKKQGNLSMHEVHYNPKKYPMTNFRIGEVRMDLNQRRGEHTNIEYFDLRVHGLEKLGNMAGGLLGLDSHKKESIPEPGCDPHRTVRLLSRATRMEADWEAEEDVEEDETGRLESWLAAD